MGYDLMMRLKVMIDLSNESLSFRMPGREGSRNVSNQPVTRDVMKFHSVSVETETEGGVSNVQDKLQVCDIALSKKQRDRLDEVISRNSSILIEDVIHMTGANLPPYRPKFLSNDAVYQRQYRIPHKLYSPVRDKLDKLEKAGIISKTCSNWNTPAMFIEKKAPSTDIRMVLDLRRINQMVEPFKYPLMRIDEIIDKLGGSKIFSTLDLNNGYFNVKLHDEVKDRFAFSAPFGRYRMEHLPQGLSTSAGWFQKIMNEALFDVISGGNCMVFQDDIIIFTKEADEHIKVIDQVLTALKKINMAVRPSKCMLFKNSLKFLGHIIDQDGFRPTTENVEVVRKFEKPTTVKQVRSFLGTVNFYRRFIPGITEVANPLYLLIKGKGDIKSKWGSEADIAFNRLKQLLTEAPLLQYPDFSKDFIIKTDASGIGMGAVLEQKDDQGCVHPVAFCSRKFNQAETRYSAIEREALAIVYALAQFKHLTYGYRILLQTDHRPLSHIFKIKDTNLRLVRWLLQVQDHNILIEYQPGKFNFVADWLSRAHSDDMPTDTIAASQLQQIITFDRIRDNQSKDDWCKGKVREITQKPCEDQEYIIDQECILLKKVIPERMHGWKYRIFAPKSLRDEIIASYHDGVLGGHLSTGITMWKIRLLFTWDGMRKDIHEFVRSCDTCQRRSMPRNHPPFQSVVPPTSPMERLSVDILGPFTLTAQRNKYVIVWVDHFSRMTFASPIKASDADTVANDYINNILPKYGSSIEIISDRGGQFTSNVMRSIHKMLGIKGVYTTPYNPQANGVTERTNSKILNVLAKICQEQYNKWDRYLPFVVQNLNNSVHRSMGESPFFVFHGFDQINPVVPVVGSEEEKEGCSHDVVAKMFEGITEARGRVRSQLTESSRMNCAPRNKLIKLNEFQPGDQVLYLDSTSYAGRNRKLKQRFKGPYRVVSRYNLVNYRIQGVQGGVLDKVVHVNKLKPYYCRNVLDDKVDTGGQSSGETAGVPE